MLAYIARRLLAMIPVMAVVAVLVFFMLRLTPGDPAAIIAGAAATSQDIVDIRQKLGLERLPIVQGRLQGRCDGAGVGAAGEIARDHHEATIAAALQRCELHGFLPPPVLPLPWERGGVRGYGLSLGCNPSPGL